jgi:uncharacterized membrane protein YqjE
MATVVWITIAVLALIICVISVVDIVRRHLGAQRTAAWLLIVVILPFFGSLLYWALRKPEPDEVERISRAERALEADAGRRPFDSSGPWTR